MEDHAANKRSALLVASLSSFLTPFMGSSVTIALPSIGKEFGMDAVMLSWVATSYILAAAMFLVPFGRMADIHGRKRVFLWGISIFTASSVLVATSTSVATLISFRVLQGIGSSMIFGTGMAILTAVYPSGERGRALGINVAAVYSGGSAGPFFGGLLTQHFGWRSVFLVALPLGLMIIFFIFWKLKGEWAEARGERFDFPGAVLYGLTLVAIMYGFSLLPALRGAWLVLAGALGLCAFIAWESRAEKPVLDVRQFRSNRVFALSNLAALINYSATSAVGFLLSLYLQYTRGLSPQSAGLILVSQPIVQTVFSPFAGRLSDRIEPRAVASTGMAFTASGLFLLTLLGERTGLEFIIASLVFLGFGFALFSSPNSNAVMSSVEKRYYGVASGTLSTMRLTGNMLSMGIVMLIFSVYLGGGRMSPQSLSLFLKCAKTAFAIFGTLCCGGILASLARGRIRLLLIACLLSPIALWADPLDARIPANTYVDGRASVIGDVVLGQRAFIAPNSSIRGEAGASVVIGDESSVQDGAVVIGISNFGLRTSTFMAEVRGVRVGRRTTVAAQAQVHGPARVGDDVFVGMRALLFSAEVSDRCVIEPGAVVMGVRIPPGRYVPSGLVVIDQDAAEALPEVGPRYLFHGINEKMVAIYTRMAEEYRKKALR